MGIGAEVKLKIYEAPGGCTSTSAPIPPTRLLLSSSSPVVIPTTSSTIPTSMATARMLTTVRTGRWSTFSMIILLTTRTLRLRAGRQIHKLRLLGLFEQEFFGLNRLVERGLLDRNRQAVVFDRAVEVYAGRIADALEVPVLGVLNALGVAALRPINLHTRNFEARPVEPDLPPEGQVPAGGGLEHIHDVVTAASFFGLFGEDLFAARVNGRDQQSVQDVLRAQVLQRVFGRSAGRILSDDEFFLGGDVDPKLVAVRHHVQDFGAHDGGLAKNSNRRGLFEQDEPLDVVVLADDAGINRARLRLEVRSRYQRADRGAPGIDATDEVSKGRLLRRWRHQRRVHLRGPPDRAAGRRYARQGDGHSAPTR